MKKHRLAAIWAFEAILCNKRQNKIIQLNFCQVGCYLAECGTVGWLVLIQLYKDMVYNKIFKKETFEIFFQYCITRQKWAGTRGPLARGPYHKGPFLKYLWLKDLQNQRTFGQRIFAPKDLFQKDLLSKGPFGTKSEK